MPATQYFFHNFKPGRHEDAIALLGRGTEIAERHGASNGRAYSIVQGENSGMVYAMLDCPSLAAHGAYLDQLAGDQDWQDLVVETRAEDSPLHYLGGWVARSVGTYGQLPDNPQVVLARIWDVKPGRMDEFLGIVEEAQPYVEQHGGGTNVYQIIVGGQMSGVVTSGALFPSQAALYGYLDAVTGDPDAMAIAAKIVGDDAPATTRSTATAVRLPV